MALVPSDRPKRLRPGLLECQRCAGTGEVLWEFVAHTMPCAACGGFGWVMPSVVEAGQYPRSGGPDAVPLSVALDAEERDALRRSWERQGFSKAVVERLLTEHEARRSAALLDEG